MAIRNQRGFTLIEVVVVAAIIAVLAGILVPMIFKEVDESKISRAQADCKSIMSAIQIFRKDTGLWPTKTFKNSCLPSVTLLQTHSGDLPTLPADWDSTSIDDMENQIRTTGCYDKWKGPYMASLSEDPWGKSYVINAKEFAVDDGHVFIMSAGPDGIVQTTTLDDKPQGDDIGFRIK